MRKFLCRALPKTESQKARKPNPQPIRDWTEVIQQLNKLAEELQDSSDASKLKALVRQFVADGEDNVKWWTETFKTLGESVASPRDAMLGDVSKVLVVLGDIKYVGPVFKVVDYLWKWADQIKNNNVKIAEVAQKMSDMVQTVDQLEGTAPRIVELSKAKLLVGINVLLLIYREIASSTGKKVFYSGVYAGRLNELELLLQGVYDEVIIQANVELLSRIAPLPEDPQVETLNHMVGLGKVHKILSLLDVNSKGDEIVVVLVHGMGGIGKSELANKVYENVRKRHKYRCCLLKLGEDAKDDAVCGQQELFAQHLGCPIAKSGDMNANLSQLTKVLKRSKQPVMVRLDDVWYDHQVPYVLPLSSFPKGSRIVITSRNADVTAKLASADCLMHKYSVAELDWDDASQLFAHHVCFNKPGQTLESILGTHARDLLEAIGGLPLWLEVVGARLNQRPDNAALVLEDLKHGNEWQGGERTNARLASCLGVLKGRSKAAFPAVAFLRGLPWACVEACFENELRDLEVYALVKNRMNEAYGHVVWMHDLLAAEGRKLGADKYLVDAEGCSDAKAVLGIRIKHGKQVVLSDVTSLRYLVLESGSSMDSLGSTQLQLFSGTYPPDVLKSSLKSVKALHSKGFEITSVCDYHNLTALELAVCGLSQFPDGISDLKCLKHLNLSDNKLSVELPASWSVLVNLKYLDLHNNQLGGKLPASWSTLVKLECLYLWTNQLSGELPASWSTLVNMQDLHLSVNQLSGEPPASWSALVNLKYLKLAENQLSGELPASWSALVNMNHLGLYNQQVSGELSASWSALVNLTRLVLHNNQLSGELPASWSALVNLEHLVLSNNQLSGELPASWSALGKLQHLFLASNQLSGELPASWSTLVNLEYLPLPSNQLSGKLPPSWSALVSLQKLDLSSNQLSGELPVSWSALVNLECLPLPSNQLSGKLPASWSALVNLQYLGLENNQLSSELPASWSALVNLHDLRLASNQLSGKLPTSWSALVNLKYLDLENNQLSSELPASWSALVSLHDLRLASNQLSGEVPASWSALVNLKYLDLENNQLSGELPASWSALVNLQYLRLASNQLSGEVPASWSALVNLHDLHLASNQLSGKLPASWSALVNLQYLDLENNQLSGELPPSWSALVNLQDLWLHSNQLSGELPASWSALVKLE